MEIGHYGVHSNPLCHLRQDSLHCLLLVPELLLHHGENKDAGVDTERSKKGDNILTNYNKVSPHAPRGTHNALSLLSSATFLRYWSSPAPRTSDSSRALSSSGEGSGSPRHCSEAPGKEGMLDSAPSISCSCVGLSTSPAAFSASKLITYISTNHSQSKIYVDG
ncbi:hypothetical protein E2C01_032809 [Portunus trituberculatus]|uniref:Uncharacterized protein n=1 Tax=Portunus trituberculatus TaxID=210409 RepID=A0A5B7F263_PORTR|nr:hypothetical protein [Portunus trituberculatus]